MAVTILQNPSDISLAGNPVIVKAYTNLHDLTFLKICIRLTITLYKEHTIDSSTFDLSIPTSSEAVIFNFSSFLQSAFTQLERDCLGNGEQSSDSSGYIRYNYKAWDEYLGENNETISTESTFPVESGYYYAIPGAYTEIQRRILPEDTGTFLGTAKVMSNKPNGETIQSGSSLIFPLFTRNPEEIIVAAESTGNEKIELGTFTTNERETVYNKVNLNGLSPGEYSITFKGVTIPHILVNIIPEQQFSTYFEFYNRLGGLESITCYSRHSHKLSIGSERNIKYQSGSFRPTGRYFKHVSSDEQMISMSTGPVNREWAKWFVQEFFQSKEVWMKDKELGIMLPVIIEFDEEIDLYNENEAQLLNIEFDVVKSINGYNIGHFGR